MDFLIKVKFLLSTKSTLLTQGLFDSIEVAPLTTVFLLLSSLHHHRPLLIGLAGSKEITCLPELRWYMLLDPTGRRQHFARRRKPIPDYRRVNPFPVAAVPHSVP